MADLKPNSIVTEGDGEALVYQDLLALPSAGTPQEKGEHLAKFVKSKNDPDLLPYQAFEVALKVAMALPPDHEYARILVHTTKALNREGLFSEVRISPPPLPPGVKYRSGPTLTAPQTDIQISTRDAWNRDETDPGWESLHAFSLRLMLAGFRRQATYGIWALRDSLESEAWPLKPSVAINWWVRGSRVLLEEIADGDAEVWRGPQYKGPETVDAERWAFWEDRMFLLCTEGAAAAGRGASRCVIS